ncbi:hypothetical protein GOBAR_AA25281 [Gossypium barbadense]|uniref:Uncharacterized protein n=1 Tax=Gossypium barbadense TaxID=3634 RepID=A0A2P5WWE8_GOSBA|nr:hypothetical protein GOBAR_AA25281 [Gossypium barbadense]
MLVTGAAVPEVACQPMARRRPEGVYDGGGRITVIELRHQIGAMLDRRDYGMGTQPTALQVGRKWSDARGRNAERAGEGNARDSMS